MNTNCEQCDTEFDLIECKTGQYGTVIEAKCPACNEPQEYDYAMDAEWDGE